MSLVAIILLHIFSSSSSSSYSSGCYIQRSMYTSQGRTRATVIEEGIVERGQDSAQPEPSVNKTKKKKNKKTK